MTHIRVSQEWIVEAIPTPGLSLDDLEQRLLTQGMSVLRKDEENNRLLLIHLQDEQ